MSAQLVIAIDCDDVLVPSTERIINMYNQRYGTDVQPRDAHSSASLAWQASREEIAERIYDIQLTEEYAKTAPFSQAIDVCQRLARSHELHLVTARPGRVMSVTIAMLERYFRGLFKEIEHVGLDGSKGEVCRRLQADVLIDDNYKHLQAAQACSVSYNIWFGDYPWQDRSAMADNMVQCKTWRGVEQEIDQIAARR